jgi:hypothetical protein
MLYGFERGAPLRFRAGTSDFWVTHHACRLLLQALFMTASVLTVTSKIAIEDND